LTIVYCITPRRGDRREKNIIILKKKDNIRQKQKKLIADRAYGIGYRAREAHKRNKKTSEARDVHK